MHTSSTLSTPMTEGRWHTSSSAGSWYSHSVSHNVTIQHSVTYPYVTTLWNVCEGNISLKLVLYEEIVGCVVVGDQVVCVISQLHSAAHVQTILTSVLETVFRSTTLEQHLERSRSHSSRMRHGHTVLVLYFVYSLPQLTLSQTRPHYIYIQVLIDLYLPVSGS